MALNFCGSLILRIGDFFCVLRELIIEIGRDWFFLLGINLCDLFSGSRVQIEQIKFSFLFEYMQSQCR